jgi:hypothetical protein
VFAEKRLGTRAKHINDMMHKEGPMMIKMLLDSMQGLSADKREELERRLSGLGYCTDMLRKVLAITQSG